MCLDTEQDQVATRMTIYALSTACWSSWGLPCMLQTAFQWMPHAKILRSTRNDKEPLQSSASNCMPQTTKTYQDFLETNAATRNHNRAKPASVGESNLDTWQQIPQNLWDVHGSWDTYTLAILGVDPTWPNSRPARRNVHFFWWEWKSAWQAWNHHDRSPSATPVQRSRDSREHHRDQYIAFLCWRHVGIKIGHNNLNELTISIPVSSEWFEEPSCWGTMEEEHFSIRMVCVWSGPES